jgi:hypothetical protein
MPSDNCRPPRCPSAQPGMDDLIVFGVLEGSAGNDGSPRVGYLTEPLPATEDVLTLAGPVAPGEIFRMAAPCGGTSCRHFDGADCRLAARIVTLLPIVVESVPPCSIRAECRWWKQEGKAACLRCPQVITERFDPPEAIRQAADPLSPVERQSPGIPAALMGA